MNKKYLHINALWLYIIKFTGAFCVCYFGTLALIGIAAPGGYYIPFVAHYLDYVNWLRTSLLLSAKYLLSLLGYDSIYFAKQYILEVKDGWGIRMVYSCIGYGIMSFWVAFVYANTIPFRKKTKWMIGGLLSIWAINVLRITLLIIVANKHWLNMLPLEHHMLFNIAAYILVGIMIYCFYRSDKRTQLHAD